MSSERRQDLSALVPELAELARNAPAKLGDRIASLSIREQAEVALRLPPHQRLELLLHAPRPMRLVRTLPESELYLTVREVGPTDALPLIALASAPQLQFLLDLESWRRDRFDADRSGAWIALMLEAGEPTIRRFLRGTDETQLALLFQRWARVEPIVHEEDHGKHGQGMTETGDAADDKFLVQAITAFFEVATIGHLRDQVCRADQVTADDVTRIIKFDLVEIKLISREVHDHAANRSIFSHAMFGQVASQEISAPRYVIERELGTV